jgi:uncharacterized heparinase superfamily protein
MLRSEIARWFHTVRYLRGGQILASCPKPLRRPRLLADVPVRTICGPWRCPVARGRTWRGPNRISILNQEREIIAWEAPEWPRLWAYTLHYFDFPDGEWIRRWIAENRPGRGIGWKAYPTSRRIVNWIKFALDGGELPAEAFRSLATQAESLNCNVEHRVRGNHILSNAKALIFAGSFFQGVDAKRWQLKGLRILNREIHEQILPDGGHFERSPMYHSIVLEDILDLINLATAYAVYIPCLEDVAALMCAWLRTISHPDGQIPFFNDATFGVAPSPSELFEYAGRMGIHSGNGTLSESGYIRLESNGTVILFDAGPIGPDYQPGHAHADTLSFEMSTNSKRVLVNSGTSTYERGKQRDWERGSAAHNTIRVDGVDQSDVWHSFRVGRRARPFDVRTDNMHFVEAAHNGYRHLHSGVIHRRSLRLIGKDVEVTDSLEGAGLHRIEIFFHIHPGAAPQIHLDPALYRSSCVTTYHPGFNLSVPKTTIVAHYSDKLPAKFKSYISAQ